MAQAKQGDTVKAHYTGKLEDGKIFDSSLDRAPLEFKIGEGRVIPGFEEAVIGMTSGEEKAVKILSDKAYGPHRKELIVAVDRKQFPSDLNPAAGMQLQVKKPDGQMAVVVITDVSEASVSLDANHPLAGKDLTFDIQLVEVT